MPLVPFQFSDPAAVARHADRPIRLVPGFLDLQKTAAILLAERAPPDGDYWCWVPVAGWS